MQINEVILEVIALISREIEKNGISAQTQLSCQRFREIASNYNK